MDINYAFRVYEDDIVIFYSLPLYSDPLEALMEMKRQFEGYKNFNNHYSADKVYRFEVVNVE